jgi:hypothetical protein
MEITVEKLVALGEGILFCVVCWIHMWVSGALSQFFIPPVVLLLPLALIWLDDLLGSISGFREDFALAGSMNRRRDKAS